ncbi:MAG: hypothetical protein ACERK6_12670 [Candidatus Aminicenantaceae bacterium]
MTNSRKYFLKTVAVGLMGLSMVLSAAALDPSIIQDKKIDPQLLDQIAGNYEFEYQGQFMVFVFTVEDGNLMGAPENETPDTLEPMVDKETTFLGYSPDGAEYQFAFKKDADGKYTICVVNIPDMGMEVEGVRIK